jgi:hypothetical protein
LSYRSARLHKLAGWFDNSVPTRFPVQQFYICGYARVDLIPLVGNYKFGYRTTFDLVGGGGRGGDGRHISIGEKKLLFNGPFSCIYTLWRWEKYIRNVFFIKPLCKAAKCLHIQCKSRGIGLTSNFSNSVTKNRDLQYRNLKRNNMLKRTFNRRN